jgi:hypothetical protein
VYVLHSLRNLLCHSHSNLPLDLISQVEQSLAEQAAREQLGHKEQSTVVCRARTEEGEQVGVSDRL